MQQELLNNTGWLEDTPVSGMRYLPRFLDQTAAQGLLQKLLTTVDWRQEQLFLYGRTLNTPRLTAWCGDRGVCYAYSGIEHLCGGWIPDLIPLGRRLAQMLGVRFNFVLLNYYRDGRDSMAWHSDDEPALGECPCIASVSLGAIRRFRVRERRTGSAVASGTVVLPRRSSSVDLQHGSLLVMQDESQLRYQHALPSSNAATGERVNMTFREILPSGLRTGESLRA